MTEYDRVYINIQKLNSCLRAYRERDLTEEVTGKEVKDIFLDVYYSGRDFELKSGSALVEIGLNEVLKGEDKTTVKSLLTKLCAIREDCH